MAESKSPGDGIDTGTGGFKPEGVSDKRHTFNVGDELTAASADVDWSPGEIKVDNAVRDLSTNTKVTLATYLSRTTLGKTPSAGGIQANKYPIEHNSAESPSDLKLRDELGYTQPLAPTTANQTQPHYADVVPGDSRSSAIIGVDIVRGLEKPPAATSVDGNDLLRNAVTPPAIVFNPPPAGTVNVGTLKSSSPVKTYVVKTLGSNLGDVFFNDDLRIQTPSTPVPPTDAGKAYHLHKVTRGQLDSSPTTVDNAYPIDNPSGQDPTKLELLDEAGYPVGLTVTSQTQQKFSEISTGRSNDAVNLNILRGREKPVPSNDPKLDKTKDGNKILSTSTGILGGAKTPPDPGTINSTTLLAASPVKYYTEGLVGKNKNTSDKTFVDPQNSVALRPANQLETTTFNGFTPQDISDKKKKTLRDYLGGITTAGIQTNGGAHLKGNTFSLDSDKDQPETLSKDGYPQKPHASPNTQKFVDDNLLKSKSAAAKNLDDFSLSRTDSEGSTVNGHQLLRDATGGLGGKDLNPSAIGGKLPEIQSTRVKGAIKTYYGDGDGDVSDSVIYNRFNPDKRYDAVTDLTEQYSSKYKMGTSVPDPGTSRSVSYRKLAQVGNSLSLRSGIELFSMDDRNDPTGGPAQAEAILPGLAQLGVQRVERFQLEAADVLRALPGAIDEDILIDPAALSWGSLNNTQDQFSGISAFGMQLLAVALLVAIAVVIAFINLLFIFPNAQLQNNTADNKGRRPYGFFEVDPGASNYADVTSIFEAIFSGRFNFWRMVGIQNTKNKFEDCLPVGALAFFGVSAPDVGITGMLSAAAGAILSVAQNPGFYTVMSRAFSRSFVLLGDAFSGLAKAFGSGLVAGLKALLEIIEVLRNSKLMKSINIFTQLGDTVLRLSSTDDSSKFPTIDKEAGGGFTQRFNSLIDHQPNGEAVKGHRLKTRAGGIDPLTLAWASYRAPDKLILPNALASTIFGLQPDFGVPPMLPDIQANVIGGPDEGGIKHGGVYVGSNKNRISTKDREALENALESEYVPFYLHDVRTNEIISFHAFLASLTDDYTASYDTFDAFGRVEPVKIYKSTTRKIGFSFYIAATNPQDFNSMWLKINKLTTMVYPQFTRGRALSTENGIYKMLAPFSETISSAPLIRVRIGDLIRSNYSKFNLARMFGMGTPGTSFATSTGAGVELTDSGAGSELASELKAARKYTPGYYYTSNLPLAISAPTSGLPGLPPPFPGPAPKGLPLPVVFALEPTGTTEDRGGKKFIKFHIIEKTGDDKLALKMSDDEFKEIVAFYSGEGGTDYNISTNPYYLFDETQVSPTPATLKKIKSEIGGDYAKVQKYYDAVSEFMNDDLADTSKGNAIARSFRTSGGRGLAGFIESMSFDWYDKVTWDMGDENYFGRRAPKMCKVTVSFSPIHDIAPGLDESGFNRAAIYPVGPFNSGLGSAANSEKKAAGT